MINHYHLLQDLSLVGSYVLKQQAIFFFVSHDVFLPADNNRSACAVLVVASSVAANSSSFLAASSLPVVTLFRHN
jgi:hypothetical protein